MTWPPTSLKYSLSHFLFNSLTTQLSLKIKFHLPSIEPSKNHSISSTVALTLSFLEYYSLDLEVETRTAEQDSLRMRIWEKKENYPDLCHWGATTVWYRMIFESTNQLMVSNPRIHQPWAINSRLVIELLPHSSVQFSKKTREYKLHGGIWCQLQDQIACISVPLLHAFAAGVLFNLRR